MLDGGQWAGAGAPVIAGDSDVVGMCLGDPRRHRAHPHLGDQFDRDPGLGIDVFQVMNELCQILDRVDIVVRRR